MATRLARLASFANRVLGETPRVESWFGSLLYGFPVLSMWLGVSILVDPLKLRFSYWLPIETSKHVYPQKPNASMLSSSPTEYFEQRWVPATQRVTKGINSIRFPIWVCSSLGVPLVFLEHPPRLGLPYKKIHPCLTAIGLDL